MLTSRTTILDKVNGKFIPLSPRPLPKSGMGKWRVLAFVRLHPWLRMKPNFRRTAAILKLLKKHKGPSRNLNGVRTEILALTFYAVSQITVENSLNPSMWNKKEKLVKTNSIFFLLWKRDRKVMKIRWKKLSHLKRYQIFSYRSIPNTENQRKTLIVRKQQPFRGLRKKQKNNSYLLTKWRTKIKFPSLHEILFWLQQASYKHC